MAVTKTTRMDAQGRVILPPHIRKELNLAPSQLVTVTLEGDTITIRAAEVRCAICGKAENAEPFIRPSGVPICRSCAQAIATTVKEETR